MMAMGRKGGPRDTRFVDPMTGRVLTPGKPSSSADTDSSNIEEAKIVDTSTS
ncbi:30S ribosomal protein S16-2 chloroplastic/mitochondrial [Bienertia sinuspersici]